MGMSNLLKSFDRLVHFFCFPFLSLISLRYTLCRVWSAFELTHAIYTYARHQGIVLEERTIHEHLQPYTHTQQKTLAGIYTDIHTVKYTAFFHHGRKFSGC